MATKQELKQRLVDGVVVSEKDIHDLIDVAGERGPKGNPGAKGEPGADGKDGAPGADGQDGADGFGTEAQYNDIIARLEALESLE